MFDQETIDKIKQAITENEKFGDAVDIIFYLLRDKEMRYKNVSVTRKSDGDLKVDISFLVKEDN